MSIKLILASLVLGSSALAAAAPAAQAQPIVARPVVWHGPAYPTVTLASDQKLVNGRRVIDVGRQAGRFATIKLEADGGRTYIQRVVVKFADGERQVIDNVGRTLVANDCVTLDLKGNRRAIASVAVFGRELNNGFRYERAAFRLTAS